MHNAKIENLFNLALDATPAEREQSLNLGTGYFPPEQDVYKRQVLDYGQEVLRQTFQTLDENGILYAGAGEIVEEASALRTI